MSFNRSKVRINGLLKNKNAHFFKTSHNHFLFFDFQVIICLVKGFQHLENEEDYNYAKYKNKAYQGFHIDKE